ncbi:Mga1 protein [Maudiozyma humilis]|uniref:Mga1 protein n=1 Tax=Maudiozyma humilis TaxID=51915 RepID=A0AAV5RUJ0_MAUHU|nr:Mga1 protein [Kazachstania humilis]
MALPFTGREQRPDTPASLSFPNPSFFSKVGFCLHVYIHTDFPFDWFGFTRLGLLGSRTLSCVSYLPTPSIRIPDYSNLLSAPSAIQKQDSKTSTQLILQNTTMQHLKFIHKLHSILSRPELQDWIFWSKQDSSVFIVKPYDPNFSSQVLKRYFKHGNVSSFVRQLHMYGFHKISSNHSKENLPIVDKTDIKWSFTHPSGYFHKDAYPLTLNNIQRKRTGLGKDGKRKNILSPVSVSFINAAGSDARGMPMAGGMQQGMQNMPNYMMGAQQQTMDMMASQQQMIPMNSQSMVMPPQVMNGHNNETPEGNVYMTDPLGRLHLVENGFPMHSSRVMGSDSQENMAMNLRRQSVPRYSMAPNPQLAQYQPTAITDGQNGYRPYYPPTAMPNHESQQTGNLPRSQNTLPLPQQINGSFVHPQNAYGYPKSTSPASSGATILKPIMKPNAQNEPSEVESVSALSTTKRQSIALSDINNTKPESAIVASVLPPSVGKPEPLVSIPRLNHERPQSGQLLHSSSNETLGSAMNPTNGPLSEAKESRILEQAYEEKIKYIDTSVDMLMQNIANVESLVRKLAQEKTEKTEDASMIKTDDDLLQKRSLLPKASVKNTFTDFEHLEKVRNLLDDLRGVMQKHNEITQ